MSDSDDLLARLSEELARRKPELEHKREELDAIANREAEDRSWIAKRIINVFVGAVAAVLIILLVAGFRSGEWNLISSQAADVIKTAVLPVVTLVLGFYFGSRASGKG